MAIVLIDATVTFMPGALGVPVERGVTVLALAAQAGAPLRALCGGIGNCTTCRVRVVAGEWPAGRTDRLRLGFLVEHGWRLACQYSPRGPLTVERPTVNS